MTPANSLVWSKRSVITKRRSEVHSSRWTQAFCNFESLMASISREVTELLNLALELPATDRAELAGSILESLD
jgi:hypothetical protein